MGAKPLLMTGLLLTAAAAAADLVLGENGKTEYQVVVPDAPPSPEIGAALNQTARLVQAAFKANGIDIPVVPEAQRDPARPGIFLGDTGCARANGVEVASLTGWGYVQKVAGRDLIIAGRDHPAPGNRDVRGRPRTWDRVATVKGVADFLRQYAGARFLYPDLAAWTPVSSAGSINFLESPAFEFVKTPRISVPADLNVRTIPSLEFNIGYPPRGSFHDLANNRFPLVDTVFGGHTYERAVPVDTYYDTHPEYFAKIGTTRTKSGQYCVSNPEFQDLVYQDMLGWIDRGFEVVDLGQPDGFQPCQCDACKTLFDTGDDWSEKLWILHRKLAQRVLEARPGKTVTMMAYCLTETPPKTFKEFPKNTRLMLCGTNEEDLAKWRDYTVPAGFTSYVYNWCPNLVTRYTPMRTPRFIEAQVKRLYACRVRAVYRDGPGDLYGLEGPVYYIMGRMFDDPENIQAKDMMHEFCGAAFGKAAGAMLSFYDQLYNGIELYSQYLGTRDPAWTFCDIYGRGRKTLTDPFQLLGFLYSPNLLAALDQDLTRAEKAADTDKVRARLRLVRREFDYVRSLARVIHLYHAYQVQPDRAARDRVLDAIDARNAEIEAYYDPKNKAALGAGWAYMLFPTPGHDAKHLRLAYDRYQEPFANTPLNWDTKAMRAAPLPGAKHLSVTSAAGAVTLDAPQWAQTPAQSLTAALPTPDLTRKTTLRALYDRDSVYLRFECELPPGQAGFPAAGRDGDLAKQEAVELYVAPVPGRELYYRFMAGPHPESRADAASGFITDAMDPRFGRDDRTWNGDWTCETRVEPQANRWLALFRVPYRTLGVEPPAAGSCWRGNFGRAHVAGSDQVERAIWSAAAGAKGMDDRNAFGELRFEGGGGGAGAEAAPAPHPLQAVREKLYASSFEVPAEWKALPNPLPAPLAPWLFRTDPLEQGVKDGWFGVDINEADWVPVRVPGFWAETEAVGNYQGYAWYRVKFALPAEWQGRGLRLAFGAVDEQAWVYVNGQLVREHTEKSEGKSLNALWETPFTVDVPPAQLRFGQSNVLAVRVRNDLANGGLWRPVLAYAVDGN